MLEMKKIVEVLNKEFGYPHLKKGFLKIEDNKDKTYTLVIGGRSITMNKDFKVICSGTTVYGNKMNEDDACIK